MATWALFSRHWVAFLYAQTRESVCVARPGDCGRGSSFGGLPEVVCRPLWVGLHVAFYWVYCDLMAGIHSKALQAFDGGVPTFATALGLHRGTGLAVIPGGADMTVQVVALSARRNRKEDDRADIIRDLIASAVLNTGGAALLGVGLFVAFPVTVLLRASRFRALRREAALRSSATLRSPTQSKRLRR
jgi:hypothetical protein